MLESESDSYNIDEEKLCTSKQTVPKKKKKKFIHKYNISWETHKEFKLWIASSRKGNLYFNCKVCNEDYLGGISAVKRHGLSRKHTSKLNAIKNTTSVLNMPSTSQNINLSKNIKIAETKIAMFIAEHNISFQTADHLVSLIKDISKNIEVTQNMSCNRTKCSAIVKNVLGLGIFEDLLARMRKNKFSIIVDESTDCSSVKHLAVIVRMVINFTIKDEFLCLLPVSNATAQNLYNTVTNFFVENSINYKKQLIGLGADGANVMMGANNSFQSLLKNDIPNLFVLKCTCHSLALCASYASEKLPNYIEELVRDIYSYLHL